MNATPLFPPAVPVRVPTPGQRVRIRDDIGREWIGYSIRGQEAIAVQYDVHANLLWFVTVEEQASPMFGRPNESGDWWRARCQTFVPSEWLGQRRLTCTRPDGLDILDDDDNVAVEA